MARPRRDPWVQLKDLHRAEILLILPCYTAACVGNYFRAEVYRESGWNTWREADYLLRDLREQGRVAFAAVDSSILETAPGDPRGAIVLETEMERATSPDGEDWGAPSWQCFRPTASGAWPHLTQLTEALVRGVGRIEVLGFPQVVALVNPRGYFLALAAAVAECGLMDRWTLFRVPAHPRSLGQAVRAVVPVIRHTVEGTRMPGGIVGIPALLPALCREVAQYRDPLPPRWRPWAEQPRRQIRIRPARPHPLARKVGGERSHFRLRPRRPPGRPVARMVGRAGHPATTRRSVRCQRY